MSWAHAAVFSRLLSLMLGAGSFGVARNLTQLGASGLEDVPAPFILLSALAGLGSCASPSLAAGGPNTLR